MFDLLYARVGLTVLRTGPLSGRVLVLHILEEEPVLDVFLRCHHQRTDGCLGLTAGSCTSQGSEVLESFMAISCQ